MSKSSFILYSDGACRGNPGPAAVGAILYKEGSNDPLATISKKIGRATNNIAEYRALVEGLKCALELKCDNIIILLDSELVVKQIQGKYRVKNEQLRSLHQSVIELLNEYQSWTISHIPREKNKEADKLANQALDAGIK